MVMTPEAWLAVIAICSSFLTLAGIALRISYQKPSKEFQEIINELREDNKRLNTKVARLEAKDEEREKQIDRFRRAFDYLTGAVEHDHPEAVRIAREIVSGTTIRGLTPD